jgi:outer membrane protein
MISMRNSRRAALLTAVFSLGLVASAHAETLAEAVALAYQSNPGLLRQRSILRNADEAYYRTQRSLGPTITAQVGVTGSTDNDFRNNNAGDSSGNLTAGVGASQTIYSGGRISASIKAQEATLLSQRESLRQADATLIQQVTDAYTGVLRAEQALAIANESVNVLDRSRKDADARFKVGTNTRTDLAQAESRLATARSTLTTAQNTLENAREQYRAVVGQSPTKLDAAPALTSLLPPTVKVALDSARESNPTLRQAYLLERASAAGVTIAKSTRRPQVSIGANYGYGNRFVGDNVGTVIPSSTSALTTSAQISIPLYTGLTTSSTIRSAQETNTQDRISIDQQQRAVQQTVTNAWNALIAARAVIVSSQQAVTAQELALAGVRQQLDVGIGTTLDLLNSEQDLRTVQLNLVNARFTEYSNGIALLNAMGKLEVAQFAPSVAKYDAGAHFNEVNRFSLPWEPLIEKLDTVGAAPIPVRQAGPGEVVPSFTAP